jgi:hypothetical protein
MTAYSRWVIAAIAVGALAACTSSSNEFDSGMKVCAPQTFACEGRTPGFWSNKNGCDLLPPPYEGLNALRAEAGLDPVDTCDEVDELLKVDATTMELKLIAMWTAFSLNRLGFWEGDCELGDVYFEWTWSHWPPDGASKQCKDAVEGWFEGGSVTFEELTALAVELITAPDAKECEQEALKDFFDAVNNDARLCLCDCVSGATGGNGGGGPTGGM